MRTRGAQTYPDFNPTARDASRFGYSPVRDALYNVYRFLGLATPLTYPRGLDTSHWTCENIKDWAEVAQTIVFQYNKSTEGNYYQDVDSQLATLEGKAAGMISLFYHFFRRNINGSAQWNYFKSKTENLIAQIGGEKITIVDMETVDGISNAGGNLNLKLYCNSAHTDGYKVGLYVNPAQWVSFGLGAWVNGFVDFYIIAHWQPNNNPDKPSGIDPAKVAIQQEGVLGLHSWITPIPGLVPQMDTNLLLWPLTQFEMFTGQVWNPEGNPPPPPEPPGETVMRIAKCIQPKINARPQPDKTQDSGDLLSGQTITYFPEMTWRSPDGKQEWWPGVTDHLVNGKPLIAYFAYKHPDFGAGFGLQDITPPPADFKLREGLPL